MKKLLGVSLLIASGTIFAFAHDNSDERNGHKKHIEHRHHDYNYVESKTLSMDASAFKQFVIEAGAGSLNIIGSDQTDITVTADVFKKSDDTDYCLSLEAHNKEVIELAANTCEQKSMVADTLIDLEVKVPSSMLTKVTDSSGSLRIENASIVSIKDGSGSIKVARNHSSLTIDDGSGSITIANVNGDLSIEDGSGSISIEHVVGHVTIDDGSGSISVNDATKFTLIDDSSGSVSLRNIKESTH
ncbi:hypothetical protein [Thalassotalea fusca]